MESGSYKLLTTVKSQAARGLQTLRELLAPQQIDISV